MPCQDRCALGCIDRLEDWLYQRGYCKLIFGFLNRFMKQLGNALVFAVYILTAVITFTSYAILLPYEQKYQSPWILSIYAAVGFYFCISIVYHYTMARTLPPISNHGKEGDKWCSKCANWKCPRTHHCSVCQKCVLGMDHHCIWVNQCVGTHNHRHFFMFIFFLSFTTIMIAWVGFNTIYDHVFETEYFYCTTTLDYAPLQTWICDQGELARNLIIFVYLLCALLILLVGGLTLWNVYLITKGFTYVDYLLSQLKMVRYFVEEKGWDGRTIGYRNPYDLGWRENWRNFLGLRRNRTFWRHVLLPSGHPPIIIDEKGDPESVLVVEQV
ncbi:unnamed protein product, partial [Mesorhabditis belari]|uniref:Palmitoyltransferase n=1 Tax=Mesorhabditis belari TaxID=2138241 RepID=A0AAF3EK49_9BILA